MEPYEDYVPDDLLRLEIRETVAAPPTTFVLPSAGWIGRPMQRTVKASGRLHPRQQTQHRRICIKLHERPRMGRGRSLWERSG